MNNTKTKEIAPLLVYVYLAIVKILPLTDLQLLLLKPVLSDEVIDKLKTLKVCHEQRKDYRTASKSYHITRKEIKRSKTGFEIIEYCTWSNNFTYEGKIYAIATTHTIRSQTFKCNRCHRSSIPDENLRICVYCNKRSEGDNRIVAGEEEDKACRELDKLGSITIYYE